MRFNSQIYSGKVQHLLRVIFPYQNNYVDLEELLHFISFTLNGKWKDKEKIVNF